MAKTVNEWFNELPDGYRQRAICNTNKGALETYTAATMVKAIYGSFRWSETPEGVTFWSGVKNHYANGTPLPPPPEYANIPMSVFLDYELRSSLWASWIGWDWAQNISAKYFVWKVLRKYARYKKSKYIEQSIKQNLQNQ